MCADRLSDEPPQPKAEYVPEIDGLRAVAVGAVMLFHFEVEPFTGGFVGVDVFLVISGFLITSIINRELISGKFTLYNFWIRRARRILPASITMMLVTCAIFAFIYPPALFRELVQSLGAQAIFGSNILFWSEAGYFADSANLKPLLHTWSLSLEEQFYLLFPTILIICARFRSIVRTLLVAIIVVASFVLCVSASTSAPISAFYLLPYRAWELGVGALLALLTSSGSAWIANSPRLRETLVATGLGSILVTFLVFDRDMPFPSYTATLPVAGAAMVIAATVAGKTCLGVVLRWRPVVGIGLISYSLYLWHWPVFVLFVWLDGWPVGLPLVALGMFVSLALAVISYRYVETPIRADKSRFPDRAIVVGSVASFVGLIAGSLMLMNTGNDGLVDRDGTLAAWHDEARALEPHANECLDQLRFEPESGVSCLYQNSPSTKVDLFLWGDSQASTLVPAFERVAADLGLKFDYAVSTGCVPVVGMRRVDHTTPKHCARINDAVMNHLVATEPSIVVLAGSYISAVKGGTIRDVSSPRRIDGNGAREDFEKRLDETVESLHWAGSRVAMIVEPPRPVRHPVVEELRARTVGAQKIELFVTRNAHQKRVSTFYSRISMDNRLEVIDLSDEFCNSIRCELSANGRSLYRDRAHLSNFGASRLIGALTDRVSMLISGMN